MTVSELSSELELYPNKDIEFCIMDIDGNIVKNLLPCVTLGKIVFEFRDKEGHGTNKVLLTLREE